MSKNYKEKIQMKFNVSQLDKLILALINNPSNKRFVSNVSLLFNEFITESYTNDFEKEFRVFAINRLTKAILENNIQEKSSVLNFTDFSGKFENQIVELLNQIYEEELSESDLLLIDKQVSQQLRYGLIGSRADTLSEMLTDYQTENYENLDDFIGKLSSEINTFEKQLTNAKESLVSQQNDISLSDNSFLENLKKIISIERSPSSKIKTGIIELNKILSGGWARKRLYVCCGLAKGGKSVFLLNAALWAIRYNDLKAKDPTKRPVVLYVSQENTVDETIMRIWCHCFGNNSNISEYEPAEAARMLESRGIFTPNDPSKPELLIWYRPNKSINTADLQAQIEDLSKSGKECVFLVHDYLKRIRPVSPNKDLRIELSDITNEFSTMAKELDIPILTASQLNREAFRHFDEAETITGQVNAFSALGSSHIGESLDIIQNCDLAFTIARAVQENKEPDGEVASVDKYLFFKVIATRMAQPAVTQFQHRFEQDNDLKFVEDIQLGYSTSIKDIKDVVYQQVKGGGQVIKGKRQVI